MIKKQVIGELKRIAEKHNGLLQPDAVVKEAKPKTSPLHSYFEWNNSAAAYQHRLWQARSLIRVAVEIIAGVDSPVDVFVSLSNDRGKKRGGYRLMVDVLSDGDLREQMLSDALKELVVFRDKYKALRELAEVFHAITKCSKCKK